MRAYLLITAVLLATQVQAEIYKTIDADGNVLYTDQPLEGAKPITLPKPSVYTPGPLATPAGPPSQEEDAGTAYTALSISTPAQDETFFNSEGLVQVQLDLEPALDLTAGHKMVVDMDGTRMVSTGTSYSLGNIERGSHTIRAEVVDRNGKPLITSAPVTFHFRQPSLFMPKHPNNPANQTPPKPKPTTPGP
jgi:hypothetical protein